MSKTNFTKVEDALTEGLDKIQKERLLEEADLAQGKPKRPENIKDQLVAKIRVELNFLQHQDKKVLNKMVLTKKKLKKMQIVLEKAKKIETLHKLESQVAALKRYLKQITKEGTDEEIVERELGAQVNKRFNINDKWLPL